MKIDPIIPACALAVLALFPLTGTAQNQDAPQAKSPKAKVAPKGETSTTMAFGWPFIDPEKMKVRGGTTTGTEVTLDPTPSEKWNELHEDGLTPMQKDRRAILAMAGSYRVSFQFVETLGLSGDYTPPRPYFSWGTEEIRVLESKENLISLQHTLVMYFRDKDGKESEPMVMKHWRQDWRYEDADQHTYRGNNRWRRAVLPKKHVTGRWTQTVYQVDDSPRYEALGTWKHTGGMSTWFSVLSWRPLPRREFSVRDDYNVLECAHVITITPNGWVHTQNNRKMNVRPGKESVYVAREIGINRYERISAPDLKSPADNYYAKTGKYWKEVRTMWADVYQKYEQFELKASYEDMKLYEHHFGYAAKIQKDGDYRKTPGRKHARETVNNFLQIRGKPVQNVPKD